MKYVKGIYNFFFKTYTGPIYIILIGVIINIALGISIHNFRIGSLIITLGLSYIFTNVYFTLEKVDKIIKFLETKSKEELDAIKDKTTDK